MSIPLVLLKDIQLRTLDLYDWFKPQPALQFKLDLLQVQNSPCLRQFFVSSFGV